MFGIGWTELIIVGVVALIFLGEDKFPEFVKVALRAFKDFRGYWDEIKGQVENEVRRPLERELKPLQRELTNMTRNDPNSYKLTEVPSVKPPAADAAGEFSNTSPDMGTPHEASVSTDFPETAREPDEPSGSIHSDDAKVMQSGAMPYAGGGPGARTEAESSTQEPGPAPESAPRQEETVSHDDDEPVAPSRID